MNDLLLSHMWRNKSSNFHKRLTQEEELQLLGSLRLQKEVTAAKRDLNGRKDRLKVEIQSLITIIHVQRGTKKKSEQPKGSK